MSSAEIPPVSSSLPLSEGVGVATLSSVTSQKTYDYLNISEAERQGDDLRKVGLDFMRQTASKHPILSIEIEYGENYYMILLRKSIRPLIEIRDTYRTKEKQNTLTESEVKIFSHIKSEIEKIKQEYYKHLDKRYTKINDPHYQGYQATLVDPDTVRQSFTYFASDAETPILIEMLRLAFAHESRDAESYNATMDHLLGYEGTTGLVDLFSPSHEIVTQIIDWDRATAP